MFLFYIPLSLVVYIVFFPVFVFSILLLIFIGTFNINLFYGSLKYVCRLILFSMGLFPSVIGSFPKNGPFIVMMNHASFLDIFLYPLFMRGKWTGITAIENFQYPLLSSVLKIMRAIPINRKHKDDAIKSIGIAESVLKSGYHIGIMPEGSRTNNGKLQSFKKGGFHMAVNTSIPILPVGVSGAFMAKPKNRWWIKPGKIIITMGAPIDTKTFENNNLNTLVNLVESKIKLLSGDMHGH